MNKKTIGNALESARCLLEDEMESVCCDDLPEEYEDCISQIGEALKELNADEDDTATV